MNTKEQRHNDRQENPSITAYRTIGLTTGSWKEHFGVIRDLLWDV